MIHMPAHRDFFLNKGNVLTTGGAKHLAKGQFAIVDNSVATATGAKVVSNFATIARKTKLEMKLGVHTTPDSRSPHNARPWSSIPFSVEQIKELYVSAPKTRLQKFDDFIIGYDGINADTALDFQVDDEEGLPIQDVVLDIILYGDPIGALGMNDSEYKFKVHFNREEGQTNQEIVRKAVERVKGLTLPTGVAITEYIDIKPVDSTTDALAGTEYAFFKLNVNDFGDSNSLGDVQAQYPLWEVKLTGRTGNVSEYTILAPSNTVLAAYAQNVPQLIKECEDCPAGYDLITDGFVYSISIEDDGADVSTTIDNVPGFVSGTVSKKGQKNGIGIYTVVTDDKLTDAEIATYVGTAGIQSTAVIALLGDVKSVCFDDTITTTAWTEGENCFASTQAYTLQLRDTECGASRLAELQAAYPTLTITAAPSANSTRNITLTGTSGTANVNVNGTNYLATFTTNLTTSANNFVTTHAATILAAKGVTVTANTGVLTFVGATASLTGSALSITNASGDLAGTVGTLTAIPVTGGCQRVYQTTVVTDVVCDECSPIFLDTFVSEAPQDYDFVSWEPVEAAFDEAALMGIRITGKPFILNPNEWLRDSVPFYETSTRIKVAGGYIEEPNWSFSPQYNNPFPVKILSKAEDRDHLGGNLIGKAEEAMIYFGGVTRHKGNEFARAILGEESLIEDLQAQYVDYAITILDDSYSQGRGSRLDQSITYHIFVEVGEHQPVENLLNALGARAGLEAVQAFAK